LNFLAAWRVPIEINLSSNHTLLNNVGGGHGAAAAGAGAPGVRVQAHVAQSVLARSHAGIKSPSLIFCTDDEGVMLYARCGCPDQRHRSVAAELCLAIRRNLMPSVEVLEHCLETATDFKFGLSRRELDRIDPGGTPMINESIISPDIQDGFLKYSK
jgi:hypothetical protein